MEIRQLQSLLKLIDCNFSVSKAADEMFLVQSAGKTINRINHNWRAGCQSCARDSGFSQQYSGYRP